MTGHLYLDCDGVLADFERGVEALLGMNAADYQQRHGRGSFWKKLATSRDFYDRLEELPDARELFDGVKHLHPTILTGLPLGKWAAPQKQRWAARHFPGVPIITTMARDKHLHMRPGDVLVDDRDLHRGLWEKAGGIFVHHRDARSTLHQLAQLYPTVRDPGD